MTRAVAFSMTLEPLVCPGCRTLHDDRLDVRTLERVGELLECACGRRYPIVDGVPIVMRDPSGYLRGDLASVIEGDLAPETAALLVEGGPDDAAYARQLEHLSIYLDAHWGDRAVPAPDQAAFGLAPLVARLRALPRVGLAVELGCSVGRVLAELPADRVVGLDLNAGAVRRARRLLAGQHVRYARRTIGRHYAPAMVDAGALARPATSVLLLCADALDPPLLPERFDLVVALNMLDSVAQPRQLLGVIDGLCAPGGEIVLATPYQWQSAFQEEHERIGGADPEATLTALLTTGDGLRRPYVIEDEAEITWSLRRDARSVVVYRTHYVRARKGT